MNGPSKVSLLNVSFAHLAVSRPIVTILALPPALVSQELDEFQGVPDNFVKLGIVDLISGYVAAFLLLLNHFNNVGQLRFARWGGFDVVSRETDAFMMA